jgi:hypothetical protein
MIATTISNRTDYPHNLSLCCQVPGPGRHRVTEEGQTIYPTISWIAGAAICIAGALDATSSCARAESEGDTPPSVSRSQTASDVYIQQAHGRVAPGIKMMGKPPPEVAPNSDAGQPAPASSTAPTTCNAQNASSPACYTATQQARPATR